MLAVWIAAREGLKRPHFGFRIWIHKTRAYLKYCQPKEAMLESWLAAKEYGRNGKTSA
jgi:hypothetical protein